MESNPEMRSPQRQLSLEYSIVVPDKKYPKEPGYDPPQTAFKHTPQCQPLLKWPGGKRALLKDLIPLLPDRVVHYYEPFLGGGALFFALRPQSSRLSDTNADLINCYRQVRDRPEDVIKELGALTNSEAEYYRIRSEQPANPVAQAVRLIYLTTLSFNGIHRLNKHGAFNVPYGNRSYRQPCNPARIRAVSQALSTAELLCEDFEVAVSDAGPGDVVYLDPPYTVAHGNNGFLKYNSKIFSWEDQVRLRNIALDLVERKCVVFVTNACHESVLGLYDGFQVRRIQRLSVIAASAMHRRVTTECIFFRED